MRTSPAVAEGVCVRLHYTLTVDGAVVASTREEGPLSVVLGAGQLVLGLEEQLIGMLAGERRRVLVPPEQGYGPRNPEAQLRVLKSEFLSVQNLLIGGVVWLPWQGRRLETTVIAITDREVVLDTNHPLAGKTLLYDVEVLSVTPA
ncbi:MAG TPA: peptidylprolyl isomerase [Elusimicrobia bacterium]|nr:peptidylprolyl isomerase [Elusimicrobiota bacterium]